MSFESDSTAQRILVVEDDSDLMSAIVHSLGDAGFAPIPAASVEAGCAALKEGTISLVLLDWNLRDPSSGTIETGSRILKLCRALNPFMPVIVISGEKGLDVRTDAVLEEADSFLAKPFSMGLLVAHVRRWLERWRHEQEQFRFSGGRDLPSLEEMKRQYARWAVNLIGSVNRAAPKLGIHRHTLAALIGNTNEEEQ